MAKARNNQRSSCPEGWLKAGIKVPVSLTTRQEHHAARAVGVARSVFNLMVATHQSARAQGLAYLDGCWEHGADQASGGLSIGQIGVVWDVGDYQIASCNWVLITTSDRLPP